MLDEILSTAFGEVIMRPVGKIIGFILSRIGASILWLLRFGTRPYKKYLNEYKYGFIPHVIGFSFLFGIFLLIMFYVN